jgi:zinc protease
MARKGRYQPAMSLNPRYALLALPFLLAAPAPLWSQAAPKKAPAAAAPTPVAIDKTPWLYKDSDVPQDPDWRFGTLPNGVRYAVRKNGVPPGQVSVRVRIDAGSLMEQESERGFAHLIEHLSFRGSAQVPDGESKRVWQRLGVTFGSDSNATTTPVSTVYKLDLPSATEASLDQSISILADMMDHPNITQAALAAERPVVLAEQRERVRPQDRIGDATLALYFAGQLMAVRPVIGTVETLNGATPATIQAFHDRWYRPERATVIISGDLDPALFERMVAKHFADWQGNGPATPSPDFGKPEATGPSSVSVSEASVPPMVSMAVLRPWTVLQDTIVFNQERMIDFVAVRLINRRLESRARSGASYITASADLSDVARSANLTSVQILPLGDDWETALKDVRSVIADAIAAPATQAEIDREVAEIDSGMRNSVATAPVEAGSKKADDLVEALDINETVTTSALSYGMFQEAVAKKLFSPDRVLAASRKIFTGTATRALVNTRTPDATAQTKLAAALEAQVVGAGGRSDQAAVSFDQLPRLGKPGTVQTRAVALDDPKIEKVVFANGVNLLLFQNPGEVGRVYVRVRFGQGRNALPANKPSVAWAGDIALMPSGVGSFGQEEIDRLTGSRQIQLSFGMDDDAFALGGTTTAEDLEDQLKLIAAKLAFPGWDPKPVARARAVVLAGYPGMDASPDSVLARDLESLLHDGDPRWGTPTLAEIQALDAKSFRKLWEPLLASGGIEIQIYGDMQSEAAIASVANTFGALKPRKVSTAPAPAVRFPPHNSTPVVRYHEGQPNQAAAVIAWPTGGGTDDIRESRKLEILAAVFRDRVLDKLRSEAGVSYSPNVASQWPMGQPGGGRLVALSMLPPDKTDFFFQLARDIAADLVARPLEVDELRRAIQPLGQMLVRRSSGNMFWMQQTSGGAFDPKLFAALPRVLQDLSDTTPGELQVLAAKYLRPDKDWTFVVVPKAK